MKIVSTRNLLLAMVAFSAGLIGALLMAREDMDVLTSESLAAARLRWRDAGVSHYQLRYAMNGGDYDVECQGGIVLSALVDGKTPQSSELRMYSANGLFEVLELELENVADPAGPFAGQDQTVLMRVRFHPQLGYVERYLRSAGGVGRGAVIEGVEFTRLD